MAVVAAQAGPAGPAVTRVEADWDSAEAGWGSAVEVEAHDRGSEAATRGEEGGGDGGGGGGSGGCEGDR
eukprot:7387528-Prymnesium_polylepis.1